VNVCDVPDLVSTVELPGLRKKHAAAPFSTI
jgi:hypothetical protein